MKTSSPFISRLLLALGFAGGLPTAARAADVVPLHPPTIYFARLEGGVVADQYTWSQSPGGHNENQIPELTLDGSNLGYRLRGQISHPDFPYLSLDAEYEHGTYSYDATPFCDVLGDGCPEGQSIKGNLERGRVLLDGKLFHAVGKSVITGGVRVGGTTSSIAEWGRVQDELHYGQGTVGPFAAGVTVGLSYGTRVRFDVDATAGFSWNFVPQEGVYGAEIAYSFVHSGYVALGGEITARSVSVAGTDRIEAANLQDLRSGVRLSVGFQR